MTKFTIRYLATTQFERHQETKILNINPCKGE